MGKFFDQGSCKHWKGNVFLALVAVEHFLPLHLLISLPHSTIDIPAADSLRHACASRGGD